MDLTDAQIELVARSCHEVNRAYCVHLGDCSQMAWNMAPDWAKESAINGVKARAENPDSPPGDSHTNWLEHKKADGWVFGDVKDAAKKEHPCMVPFDQLPWDQQAKDHLFCSVCVGLFAVLCPEN